MPCASQVAFVRQLADLQSAEAIQRLFEQHNVLARLADVFWARRAEDEIDSRSGSANLCRS